MPNNTKPGRGCSPNAEKIFKITLECNGGVYDSRIVDYDEEYETEEEFIREAVTRFSFIHHFENGADVRIFGDNEPIVQVRRLKPSRFIANEATIKLSDKTRTSLYAEGVSESVKLYIEVEYCPLGLESDGSNACRPKLKKAAHYSVPFPLDVASYYEDAVEEVYGLFNDHTAAAAIISVYVEISNSWDTGEYLLYQEAYTDPDLKDLWRKDN